MAGPRLGLGERGRKPPESVKRPLRGLTPPARQDGRLRALTPPRSSLYFFFADSSTSCHHSLTERRHLPSRVAGSSFAFSRSFSRSLRLLRPAFLIDWLPFAGAVVTCCEGA